MTVLSVVEIERIIKELLNKYHAEYALLFGSYARGEAKPESDIGWFMITRESTGT